MRRDPTMTVDEGGILRLESSGVTVRITIADVFGQMSHADSARLIVALTDAQIIRAAIERLKNGYCDCPNDDDEDVIGRADLAEWLGDTIKSDNERLIREIARLRRDSFIHEQAIGRYLWCDDIDTRLRRYDRLSEITNQLRDTYGDSPNGALELCQ